jgi:hypothetical protein
MAAARSACPLSFATHNLLHGYFEAIAGFEKRMFIGGISNA